MLIRCLQDCLPLAYPGRRSAWCSVFLAHPKDHWGLEVVSLRPAKTHHGTCSKLRRQGPLFGLLSPGPGTFPGDYSVRTRRNRACVGSWVWGDQLSLSGSSNHKPAMLSQHAINAGDNSGVSHRNRTAKKMDVLMLIHPERQQNSGSYTGSLILLIILSPYDISWYETQWWIEGTTRDFYAHHNFFSASLSYALYKQSPYWKQQIFLAK